MRAHSQLPPLWWFVAVAAVVVAVVGVILWLLYRAVGWLLATAIVLVVAALLGAGIVYAADCELGAFGCGHGEQHEQYQDWKDKSGNGCCSGQDCRPVRARATFEGGWQIYVPEYRAWVDVPAKAVGEPDRFGDGRNHACTAEPVNWRRVNPFKPLPVYCLSPTGSKS